MFKRQSILLLVCMCCCNFLYCQTLPVHISGFVIDKKSNAIESVEVVYWNNGINAGSDFTDPDGYFDFQALIVGTSNEPGPKNNIEGIGTVFPNPFHSFTSFDVFITDAAKVILFSVSGELINELDLKYPGRYVLRFNPGHHEGNIYIVALVTRERIYSKKAIAVNTSRNNGKLSIIEFVSNNSIKAYSLLSDSISFSNINITNISIPASGNDTSFTQILNAGPIITNLIPDVVAEQGEILEWNGFNHHYNDDLSGLTTPAWTGAIIVGDSIYQYTVLDEGIFEQQLNIQDPEDPTLKKTLEWTIYVNQNQIPPDANDDYYTHPEDGGTHVAEVTENDNDPDGTIELVEILIPFTYGNSTVVNDTTIHSDFNLNFYGPDSLKYQITDNDGLTATAWAHYDITPEDDGPEQTDDIPDQLSDEDLTNIIDLSQYYTHPDGDEITVTDVANLPAGSVWSEAGNNLSMTPPLDYNTDNSGLITDVIITAEDPDGDQIVFNPFDWDVDAINDQMIALNDVYSSIPYNTATLLDVLANDQDDKDPLGGVDPSTLTLVVPFSNGTANVVNGQFEFISTVAGLDSAQYQVSDLGHPLPATSATAWVYVTVEPQGNQPPTLNLPDQGVDEDDATPETLIPDMSDPQYYSDPEGDDPTFSIVSQTNPTLANFSVSTDALILDYLQPDGNGSSIIGVEADDGNGGLDTAYFTLTVNPIADVTFEARWLMDQSLIAGATLYIGGSQYTLTNGQLTMQVAAGTQEVNVTHPNSIDNTSIWETYLAIQTPGQDANVEQRAGGDANSPVTFGTVDITYNLYKIKDTFDMYSVASGIATGPNGETIRFAWDPNNPYAYFDESGTNQTPNATTVLRAQDGIAAIAAATLYKLDMVYDQGSSPPTDPYLELAINSEFPGPENGTNWDGNFEITDCYAHWTTNASVPIIWVEMIQAVQNQNDIGQSLTSWNGSSWELSLYGESCLRFGYMFDAGTYFVTPTDNVITKVKEK